MINNIKHFRILHCIIRNIQKKLSLEPWEQELKLSELLAMWILGSMMRPWDRLYDFLWDFWYELDLRNGLKWWRFILLAPSLVLMVLIGIGFFPILISFIFVNQTIHLSKVLKSIQNNNILTIKINSKNENWITSLGLFIPRKYKYIIGDILEDYAEMREAGCTEKRIKFYIVYQWLIAIVTLVPTAIKSSFVEIIKQVISPQK